MVLQDYFPADLTLLGLRNLYSQVGKDSFFVNSNCVVAKDKILTKGRHYLIFDIPTKTGITITEIIFIDLFYFEGYIHLISQDIHSHRVYDISFCLECPTNDCTMIVVDVKYFIQRMNAKAVKDYCGDCASNNETKQKSAKKQSDDLLEFEF
jgi:hypothetical protein